MRKLVLREWRGSGLTKQLRSLVEALEDEDSALQPWDITAIWINQDYEEGTQLMTVTSEEKGAR